MLHPTIVHLPIGILLFAALCEWLVLLPTYKHLKTTLFIVWVIGAVAAVLACASGWRLQQGGGYELGEVQQHQWLGFGTALVALIACFIKQRRWVGTLVALMLMLTGHLGGSMTYGSDYLISAFDSGEATAEQSGLTGELPPNEPDQPAPTTLLQPLIDAGIVVLPVSKGSHYLSLNFVNATHASDTVWQALLPLASYITWVRCSDATLPPAVWPVLEKLENISRLHLNGTNISDANLSAVAKLKHLHYLNLNHTDITANGLTALSQLPHLDRLFLFKTKVLAKDWQGLQLQFKKVKIDSGGYVLPWLNTDTARLDAPITY